MILSFLILVLAAIPVREYWSRLGNNEPAWEAFFWKWLAQGVGVPLAIWCVLNFGLLESLPALPPRLAWAQANGQVWWNLWVQAAIEGGVFIGLAWAAITYAWLMILISQRVENTPELRATLLIVGIPM